MTMARLETLSEADGPMEIGVTFAEVLVLSAAELVKLFRREHRRAVSSRYAEVVALTAIDQSRAYEAAGCSSTQQFAAKVADYTEREVRDMLRVGRALQGCPELDAAFRSGRLSWSKVRALAPVVTNETAAKWIEKAEDMSAAVLERTVGRQRDPEGLPGMAPMPEVPIAVFVAFRQLCKRLRQRLGKPGMPDGQCAGVLFAMAGWAFEQHAEEAFGALGYAKVAPRAEAPAQIERREPTARPRVDRPETDRSGMPATEPARAPPPTPKRPRGSRTGIGSGDPPVGRGLRRRSSAHHAVPPHPRRRATIRPGALRLPLRGTGLREPARARAPPSDPLRARRPAHGREHRRLVSSLP
jgi:hypothetical protein